MDATGLHTRFTANAYRISMNFELSKELMHSPPLKNLDGHKMTLKPLALIIIILADWPARQSTEMYSQFT